MLAGLHSHALLPGWVLCRPLGWGLSALPGARQPPGAIQVVLLEVRCWHLHPGGVGGGGGGLRLKEVTTQMCRQEKE